MQRAIRCPGCGETVAEECLLAGKRFACENCAGLTFEVIDQGAEHALRQVHFASCPACEARLEIPADAKPGDTMSHCGKDWRLSFEFGTWALAVNH